MRIAMALSLLLAAAAGCAHSHREPPAPPTATTTPLYAPSPTQTLVATPPPTPAPTPSPTPTPPPTLQPATAAVAPGSTLQAPLLFYVCTGAPPGFQDGYCGDGVWPAPGSAACGWALPRGVRFRILDDPTGRSYICDDIGAYTIGYWPGFAFAVEPWFYSFEEGWAWRQNFADEVTIEILGP